MTSFNKELLDIEDSDGRFANEWVLAYSLFNLLLLVDLIMAFLFYGIGTIYKARREFLWETCIQVFFFCTIIYYLSLDLNAVK